MFPSDLIHHQRDFLLDVARLLQYAALHNFYVTAGELWRPQEMQDLYFKQGKTRAHNSNHTRRLAIDLNIFSLSGRLMEVAEIKPLGVYWKTLHPLNRWGGDFTTIVDGPHFERNVP